MQKSFCFFLFNLVGLLLLASGLVWADSREEETARAELIDQVLRERLKPSYIMNPNNDPSEAYAILAAKPGGWVSLEPSDLQWIRGSYWLFTYKVATAHEDYIRFSTYIYSFSSGANIWCYSDGDSGDTYYGDLPSFAGGGKGYIAIIDWDYAENYDFYFFSIDKDKGTATGAFLWRMGDYEWPSHHMTGRRTRSDKVNDFIVRLYTYVLGREADAGGVYHYYEALQDEVYTGSQLAKIFFFSEEFLNRNLNDNDFVNALYWALFGRGPDGPGHANWMGKLTEGWTREEVIDAFCLSDEWLTLCDRYDIEP